MLAQPQYVLAPTSAVSAAACANAPSTADCRVLEFVYASDTTATSSAFGDYAGQVRQIKLWATAPGTVANVVFALCSAIVTGLSSAASYYVETRWDGGFSWGEAISNFVIAAFAGGVPGGATKRFLKTSSGKTFLRKKTRSFLTKAAEKVESKFARIHLSSLVTRIANVIKDRLG
ncbi:hypothetical protein ABT300_16315 [Streptomyces sp. NPDC001027]|uniref:hypothetical protein n=1 Tax=Streptomyces sp. NPDC001027 TaxID=3154771 RepID=UPI003328E305